MREKIAIELTVSVGNETYSISDSYEIEADGSSSEHASELVDLVAFKMQGALSPCYYDHNISKIEISDLFKGNNNVDE